MLSRFFIERPNFAFVISMVASLIGVIAITLIPISEYPDITPPQVVVNANFPGANAALIEKTVAIPIEQRVNGVEGMLYMSSTSSNDGKYKLTVTFKVGTDPDIAAVNVQNRVSIAEPLLPASVKQQGVTTTKQSSNMLLVIALTSPDSSRDAIFLSNYASIKIQDRLSRIPGVGTVSQFGPLEYSMRVWFNPEKMTSLGLTASDVSEAIQAQNIGATAGQVGGPPFAGDTSFEFVLQGRGLLDSVEAFRNVVVKADSGKIVKLSDIARVELGSRSYSSFSSLDNRPATAIAIYQSPGANALDVADRVYAALETMSGEFPSGVAYTLPYDITRAVRASIEEIIFTLAITAVLVVAVVFLFLLSWRAVLIPTIAIPVSLLGTIGALYLIGFSANLITLFGLILAITLVVDDAIIIVENTERIMEEENLSPREATLKAMSQVTGPIIATTFVLAAVFIPVCFFPGITGRIYLQFALTITIAFTISALNALTLTPVLCANLLKRRSRSRRTRVLRVIPATVDWVRDHYVALVRFLIKTLPVWLIAYIGVILVTGYMLNTTPTGFIPLEDKGTLFVNVELPKGASLQRSQEAARQMTDLARQVDGVDSIISVSGFSIMSGDSSNYVTLIVILKPWSERTTNQTKWYNILAALSARLEQVPEATAFVFPLPPIDGLGISGGITAQIQDENNQSVEQLGAVTNAILSATARDPIFRRVFSPLETGAPQYAVDIDRVKAEALGVQIKDIFTALQANLGSLYVNNFVKDGKTYWVILAADSKYRQSLDDIGDIFVKGSSGDMIPLRSLLTINATVGPELITRYNQLRSAAIHGITEVGHSTGEGIENFRAITKTTLPKGYSIQWTGVSLQEIEAGSFILYIFGLALLFSYLCLVAQYESWILPISVMLSTVFAVGGALIPLFSIAILNNNIYAQIGIVLLIGLAAKKAIMLVEFSRNLREEGKTIVEAALGAAHTRFRPVTMTGFCFIIGVLPLVFASGAGSASRISIGLPVFSGMVIDSTIGLLAIPVLYVAIQSLNEYLFGPPAGQREHAPNGGSEDADTTLTSKSR